MPVSRFLLLVVCALAALPLLALVVRWLPELSATSPRPNRRERALLALVVCLGLVCVYGAFVGGGRLFAYRDAGLDTVDVYVPFYVSLVESLRDGTFGAWNFSYGLGASVLSYQSWLLDPFNLLVVPLGLALGTARIGVALLLAQALKVALSAWLFDCLLTRFCETPLARVLGAVTYAFGGFLMLWGQHYWLGSVSVAFVAYLLVLERLMERSGAARVAAVAAGTAICVGWSPYCGFMILVCAALYSLMRLIHRAEGPHVAWQVGAGTLRLLVPVLLGCLIACVTLMPYASYLFGETSRVSSGGSSLLSRAADALTGLVPLGWIPAILSRLLGDGLITSGGGFDASVVVPTESFPYVNCYEFVALGFGALALVLLLQFAHWAATEASRRDRALVAVACVLVVAYLVNEFLPSLLNLFVAPKYRSSFAVAVPVCLAIAVGWERRVQVGRVATGPLVAGVAASLAIVGWSLANTADGRLLCLCYLICVLVGGALLWSLRVGSPRPAAIACTLAVAVGAVVADGFFVTNNRVTSTAETFPAASDDDASTMAALAWISAEDGTLFRVEKTYADWCRYNDALVQGYYGVDAYNSTSDADVVTLFERLWPAAVEADGACQYFLNEPDVLPLLSQLGVRYLLSTTELSAPTLELVSTFDEVRVYRNDAALPLVSGKAGVMGESEANSLDGPEARREALAGCVIVPDEVATGRSGATGGETVTSELVLEGGQVVRGTAQATVDSVAVLAVPYSPDWRVVVDGVEVETFRADYGLVGFALSEGEHSIEARYELPGVGVGLVASGAGLVALGVACALVECRSRCYAAEPSIS